MLKSDKMRKTILYLFIGFMIAQPLFDIFWLYNDNLIAMFKFSPATIIRMLVMVILFGFMFIWCKDKRKYKFFIVAAIVYIIYAIFHHINSANFYVPYGYFDKYSFVKEMFYLVRMIMPLLIVFITYENKLSTKYFKTIVISVALIFSVIMVATNFLGIALASYGGGTHQIKATFFEWFYGDIYSKYQYLDIASKGIFHMANQVSGVLVCLLPLVIYIYFKKPNVLHGVTVFLTILAMIMIGTRVASMGWCAVAVAMVIIYLFFVFIKKELTFSLRSLIVLIIMIIVGVVILPYSPVMNRTFINDNSKQVEDDIDSSNGKKDLKELKKYIASMEGKELTKEEEEELKEKKVTFIKNSYVTFGVDRTYIEKIYPYTDDPDFWLQEYEIPFVDRANHRQLKTDVTHRIIELNDNKMDYVIGMSFTRLRNAPCYMENDIYVHMYSIGIIGIILFICPYLVVLGYSVYRMFKDYKNKFNFINVTLAFSVVLVFFAGIVSGNVFDEWIVTLYLGLICGMLLLSINKKEEE